MVVLRGRAFQIPPHPATVVGCQAFRKTHSGSAAQSMAVPVFSQKTTPGSSSSPPAIAVSCCRGPTVRSQVPSASRRSLRSDRTGCPERKRVPALLHTEWPLRPLEHPAPSLSVFPRTRVPEPILVQDLLAQALYKGSSGELWFRSPLAKAPPPARSLGYPSETRPPSSPFWRPPCRSRAWATMSCSRCIP